MFQTIKNIFNRENKINLILREMFKFQNIIIYVISLLISMVEIKGGKLPFAPIMVAACVGESVPVLLVYVLSLIGTYIGGGTNAILEFIFISIIYFVLVLLFKSKIAVEDRNEQIKTGGKLFLATFIVNCFERISMGLAFSEIMFSIFIAIIYYVLYKIFVNGINVIKDYNIKKAFTREELVAGAIMVCIACVVFRNIKVFDVNLLFIIMVFFALANGMTNKFINGLVAGFGIGLAVALCTEVTLLEILILILAGSVAGILANGGKIASVTGTFLIDLGALYVFKDNPEMFVYLKGILIATILLVFVPMKRNYDFDSIVEKKKELPAVQKKIAEKSKVKSELTEEDIINNVNLTIDVVPEKFVENVLKKINKHPDNIFYEELINEENGIIRELGIKYINNNKITEDDFIKVLNNHNNFIAKDDDRIIKDVKEIVSIVNTNSLKELDLDIEKENKEPKKEKKKVKNDIKETKEENTLKNDLNAKNFKIESVVIKDIDNGKKVVEINFDKDEATRLKDKAVVANISDILTKNFGVKLSFQRDRKEDTTYNQIYSSDEKFTVQVGIVEEPIEDDADRLSIKKRLDDGKYLFVLADGKNKADVIEDIEDALDDGYNKKSLEEIKKLTKKSKINFLVLDLFTSTVENYQNDNYITYIKSKKNVDVLNKGEYSKENLEEGDLIIMTNHTVLDSGDIIEGNWLETFIKNSSTNNPKKLADMIYEETVEKNLGIMKESTVIIIVKVVKKK